MKKLIGTWEIQTMDMWDEDYFNMETQAYIEVKENKTGIFQFGLVRGYFHWKIYDFDSSKRMEFTWEGNDEMEDVFGAGWVLLKSDNEIKGEFRFHNGDDSTFKATRKK